MEVLSKAEENKSWQKMANYCFDLIEQSVVDWGKVRRKLNANLKNSLSACFNKHRLFFSKQKQFCVDMFL